MQIQHSNDQDIDHNLKCMYIDTHNTSVCVLNHKDAFLVTVTRCTACQQHMHEIDTL